MSNREIKKKERQAKKEIQKHLAPINELMSKPLEEQVAEAKEAMMKIIEAQGLEEAINREIEITGNNAMIKKRFVHVYCSGKYTIRQIAQMFGVGVTTIYNWLKDPEIKEAIANLQQEEDIIVSSMMKALRRTALERQKELIESAENEMVSAIMIRDLLDRTGHKPVEKKQIDVNMTYEEKLQQLAQGIEIEYEVIEDDSDLSQSEKMNTEREDDGDD
jgi:transposase